VQSEGVTDVGLAEEDFGTNTPCWRGDEEDEFGNDNFGNRWVNPVMGGDRRQSVQMNTQGAETCGKCPRKLYISTDLS
jgi:hypothetical protein